MKTTLFASLFALMGVTAVAQGQLDCSRSRYCEMREQTVSANGRFAVEGIHNGSIRVVGSNRSDVLVRTRVETDARSQNEAKDLFGRIHTRITPGRLQVEGPGRDPISWFFETEWSVSVELLVPRNTDLVVGAHNGQVAVSSTRGHIRANTHNGSIRLTDVDGDVEFSTHNGAATLKGVSGAVRGGSHNGEIEVELTGNAGRRVDLSSHNGRVTVSLPAGYNGHVVTDTHNGSVDSDFPMKVRGWIQRRGDGDMEFDINGGGPTLRVNTHNGGVRIRRS